MPLALLVGPANAGKVSRLLDRYLENLDREPFLVVPNRAEVDRVERDLLARVPGAARAVEIGTFDDLFRTIARGGAGGAGESPPTPSGRSSSGGRSPGASLNGLGPSSRFAGFADALLGAISELESGLVDPAEIERRPRRALRRLPATSSTASTSGIATASARYAAARVEGELEAWDGRPVLAYGFEDLTGAQWALLKALAGRDRRPRLAPVRARPRRVRVARPDGRRPRRARRRPRWRSCRLRTRRSRIPRSPISSAHSSSRRARPPDPPPLDGAVRFLEGAGSRGSLELVADEVLRLLREGTAAEAIGLVCPSIDRLRARRSRRLSRPRASRTRSKGELRLGHTPFGHALLSALRFLWRGESRRDLFAFLRSPYSGLPRASADYLEGRLRGLGVRSDIEERVVALRGQPLPALEERPGRPRRRSRRVRVLGRSMLRGATGSSRRRSARPPDSTCAPGRR